MTPMHFHPARSGEFMARKGYVGFGGRAKQLSSKVL
jgi:hypothetical protein